MEKTSHFVPMPYHKEYETLPSGAGIVISPSAYMQFTLQPIADHSYLGYDEPPIGKPVGETLSYLGTGNFQGTHRPDW